MCTIGLMTSTRRLTMFCVRSVTFSIIINGAAQGHLPIPWFMPKGPVVTYLFLLVMEGLITLLTEAENKKLIRGIKICRAVPPISRLLFADDNLIFCSANLVENNNLLELLALYEWASGQSIHKEKPNLTFSKNVSRESQRAIKGLWGTRDTQKQDKYLGLRAIIGKSRNRAFNKIKQCL